MQTIIAVTLDGPTAAYEALARLGELNAQRRISVTEGGVVEPSDAVVGATMAQLGGTVLRSAAGDVSAELQGSPPTVRPGGER